MSLCFCVHLQYLGISLSLAINIESIFSYKSFFHFLKPFAIWEILNYFPVFLMPKLARSFFNKYIVDLLMFAHILVVFKWRSMAILLTVVYRIIRDFLLTIPSITNQYMAVFWCLLKLLLISFVNHFVAILWCYVFTKKKYFGFH